MVLRYGVSYRDLEQMMGERGVSVDHSTIYRWVQKYAPEIRSACAGNGVSRDRRAGASTRRYIKVRGQWAYLWRAIDKFGDTIDFYLSSTRSAAAAKRFLGKALSGLKSWELPHVINHGQGADLCRGARRVEEGGQMPRRHRPSTGQVLEQRAGGRPWQAEAADSPCSRLQDAENSLRHDQGLRGNARAAERTGQSVQHYPRHPWRGPTGGTCLWTRSQPSHRGSSVRHRPARAQSSLIERCG